MEDEDIELTPLSRAVLANDLCTVREILTSGVNPNTSSMVLDHHRHISRRETPLITAARLGHTNIVELLVSHGSSLSMTDDNTGRSALHWALTDKHFDIGKRLVLAGSSVNNTNIDGETPIVEALVHKDLDMVEFLLKHDVELDKLICYDRDTALLLAIQLRLWDEAMLLLKSGAGVKTMNRYSDDVLHLVLRDEQLYTTDPDSYMNLVYVILQVGADVRSEHLRVCTNRADEHLLTYLLSTSRNPSSLLECVRHKIRTFLLEKTERTSILEYVHNLPLPILLKKYLTFTVLPFGSNVISI